MGYRPVYLIPENDITINPNTLVRYIDELLQEIINEIIQPKEIQKITLTKIIKKKLRNSILWTGILSSTKCMYIFTDTSKNIFTICNKTIKRKKDNPNNNIKGNKFLCSDHAKEYIPSKRTYKNGSTCIGKNKKNDPCNNIATIGRVCHSHYKQSLGLSITEKLNIPSYFYNKNFKIDLEKDFWYEYRKSIDNYIKDISFVDNEIDGYYDKIISTFRESDNLFLKYSSDSFKSENKNQESFYVDYIKKESNIENIEERFNKLNNKIFDYNIKFKSLSSYIKKILKDNMEYKKDEKELHEQISSWGFESKNKLEEFIYYYKEHVCSFHPDDVYQILYNNIYDQINREFIEDFLEKYDFKSEEDFNIFITKYKNHVCGPMKKDFNIKDIDKEDIKTLFKEGITIYTENYYKSKKEIEEKINNKYSYIKKHYYIEYNKTKDSLYTKYEMEKIIKNIYLLYEDLYNSLLDSHDREKIDNFKDKLYNYFNIILNRKTKNENYI